MSTPPPPSSTHPADPTRRNFRLGVWNGALYHLGESFIDTGTVIPVLLSRLTSSNALIGLASGLDGLGWLVPQMFVAPWASSRPKQMPIYRAAALVRAAALGAIAVLGWTLRENPPGLLLAFFVCYSCFALGAGLGGGPFMELVGRTIPAPRLGAFFSQRLFWGGLLGTLAGFLVRRILEGGDTGILFATLFSIATVIVSIAYSLFMSIHEPEHKAAPIAGGPLALFRAGLARLRDEALFRRLLISRATLSIWQSASPFIVLFAVDDLAGGGRAAGTFLLARLAGFVLSNLLWQRLSRERGNRAIMLVGTALASALPAAAFLIAIASPWGLGWIRASSAVILLELLAFGGGAVHSGIQVGYASLVIELAPLGGRQAFVSVLNSFLGPTLLLPMLAGALLDRTNAPTVFALCALVSLIGLRAATRLPRNARDVPHPSAGAEAP